MKLFYESENYNKTINEIIDRYKYYDNEIYIMLEKYKVDYSIKEEEYEKKLSEIKKVLVDFYLKKYDLKNSFMGRSVQSELSQIILNYYELLKKVKVVNNKNKVYPIKMSDEEHELICRRFMEYMVEFEIKSGVHLERLFDKFYDELSKQFQQLKKKLMDEDMSPYYGSPFYIISRSKFIRECISYIPNLTVDSEVDSIIKTMEEFESKYLSKDGRKIDELFEVASSNSDFYIDYDKIEEAYIRLLKIEKDLCPIVAEYWKKYLTDPNKHNAESYRYIMHTFSGGGVEPEKITKACCSLNTDELVVTPYGNWGLIFDFDSDSLETMSTDDLGSWNVTKNSFVSNTHCSPSRWQLTNPNGYSFYYENEKNSKLIMPEKFEKICKKNNISLNGEMLNNSNGEFYSEIFLNAKAKPIGVFYTDDCSNYDEVEAYATKYGLPLVNISLKKQREIKGLPALSGVSR